MVGGVEVEAGSELDGLRMEQMSTQTRVIAIGHGPGDRPAASPPRQHSSSAGDTAYLVGPNRELLDTLHKGQRVRA